MWQILQLLFPKLFFFALKKWMNLISNQLSTTSIKYLNWPNPVFGRFQNGCNEVVIEPRVVQFWSEIILVISNWTRTARSIDFEITRMFSAQIALHSVQLPLFILITFTWLVAWWSARYRVTLSAGVTICHVNISKWGNPLSRGQKAQKRDIYVLKLCTFPSRFMAEITRNRNEHTRSVKCSHFGIFSVVNRPYLVSQTIPYNVLNQRFLAKPNTA